MKKLLLGFAASILFLSAIGQMHVKNYNYYVFSKTPKRVTDALLRESSKAARNHPEFGINPYRTPCKECVELIDKRTATTRTYIDPVNAGHIYVQTSYFPLSYKENDKDVWHTYDPRLQPVPGQPNVFIAPNQPLFTKFDLNKKCTSMDVIQTEFEFNKEVTMYYMDENEKVISSANGNYSKYTAGDEGVKVLDIWPGINMEAQFKVGQIKTSYMVNAPLNVPAQKGWLVIEDHFTLPQGFTFEKAGGKTMADGMYQGDYELKDAKGEALVKYKMANFVDARAYGMHGSYRLIQNGNSYALRMYVPLHWLSYPGQIFPLIIDPAVINITKHGDFRSTPGGVSPGLGFTSQALGFCADTIYPLVPSGGYTVTKITADLEYHLAYDNSCGNPQVQLPYPFCTFSQAIQEIFCDSCKTRTGQLRCNPADPPYTGTCTTDPLTVPGASSINIDPSFISCFQPKCDEYKIPFSLHNIDSICGDVCGYLCATGDMWQITLEGCQVHGTISQDKTQVCAGQPVTLTGHPECGVPPYHYTWTTLESGGSPVTSAQQSSVDYIYSPQSNTTVVCRIGDMCHDSAADNSLSIAVVPAPPSNAGSDYRMCEGGQTLTLGGNPTTNPASTVAWTASDPSDPALSDPVALNPTITVPAGLIDTFYYVVRATDPNCFRDDTVYIFSGRNPQPVIDSSGPATFCEGGSVTLSSINTYAKYLWNNTPAGTGRSIIATKAGQYQVTVTDGNNCTGTSNTIPVTVLSFPPFNVYPDTIIMYGDSIKLYTDADLGSPSIQSYTWYPDVNIECTDCPSPYVAPLSDQYYGLRIFANGCLVTDSAQIRIIYPNNFFIPNSFSPNNDGNNDNFFIQSQTGVTVLLFQVFDRWGEKVHEGIYPWDGNYQGKQAPAGVYTYVYKLSLFGNNKPLFRKGSVMLLR